MRGKVFFFVFFYLVMLFTASLTHAAMYVSNSSGNSVATWPNSTTGNITPTTAIGGGLTTLNSPAGVAVDEHWIYVANRNNNSILVFPKGATDNTSPTRTLSGGLSHKRQHHKGDRILQETAWT